MASNDYEKLTRNLRTRNWIDMDYGETPRLNNPHQFFAQKLNLQKNLESETTWKDFELLYRDFSSGWL